MNNDTHLKGTTCVLLCVAATLKGKIKMGDTPSVAYLLCGTPDDPSQPSWGGQFSHIWDGRTSVFDRLTTEADLVGDIEGT